MIDPITLCLAITIFFEAAGEPEAGQFAVAEVVMNRVKSEYFPDSVCKVVKQKSQFSFTKKKGFTWTTPQHENAIEVAAWKKAVSIAEMVSKTRTGVVGNALYFYAPKVVKKTPKWSKRKKFIAQIGGHRFYAEPEPKMASNG